MVEKQKAQYLYAMVTLLSLKSQLQQKLQTKWGIWLAIAILLPLGVSVWAISALMRLPAPLNCNTSTASDSGAARFYCAQAAARDGSADNLQRAIQMMDMLPSGHPLRVDGDRLIEDWSHQILAIAEEEFQQGDLQAAIDIARKIPGEVSSAQLANDTIEEWEAVWDSAETIYDDAKAAIRRRRWEEAMGQARELVRVENHYWASTQYLALLNEIQMEKESSDLAAKREEERNAKRRDRSTTASTSSALTQWEQERAAEDADRLSRARALANSRTVEGLENAISEARGVIWGTAQYEEAQSLIQDWQRQVELMEDQPYLDRAIALASQGDVESLRAAIQEARQIPSYRTLYDDAQTKIEAWTLEIEQLTVEQIVPSPPPNAPLPVRDLDAGTAPDVPSAAELFEGVERRSAGE